jgi:guanidinopropionase
MMRTGMQEAPAAVRAASRLIRRVNPSTKIAPFDLATVADVGDPAHLNPFALEASVERATEFVQMLHSEGLRLIAMGGDHVITIPMVRGIFGGTRLGLVQVDAHPDTHDEILGSRINHATPIRRIVEEGLVDPERVVQIGLRGTQGGLGGDDDSAWGVAHGFTCITADRYEELGREAVIGLTKKVIGTGPTYITFDLDGLDPSQAPGTGYPEPGGLSMRDAQVILRSLTGCNIIGGDVVELLPAADPSGVTAVNAANLMFEILCLVAAARAGESGEAKSGA